VPYRHLLLPTDGSRIAAKGVKAGIALARALGARVHGLYRKSDSGSPAENVWGVHEARIMIEHLEAAQEKKALAAFEAMARKAGVKYRFESMEPGPAWAGIVATARRRRCDLIVLASHGRGRLGTLVFGSDTMRVLSGSKIPVLVIR